MSQDMLAALGEPPEDAGSTTQSRYRYQWNCTATACIAMLVEDTISSITCEWHEDYVISFRDGRLELVSVKHREPDRGPWPLTELCNTGGLIHLFERWKIVSEIAICRISTNAGLKPGTNEARELAEICSRAKAGQPNINEKLEAFATKIAQLIQDRSASAGATATEQHRGKSASGAARGKRVVDGRQMKLTDVESLDILEAEVKRFLIRLQIQHSLPARPYIRSHNIMHLMRPALEKLGRTTEGADHYYDSIIRLVEEANSDNDGQPRSMAAYLANPNRMARDELIRDTVGRRTLTRIDLTACLMTNAEQAIRLGAPQPETLTIPQGSVSRLVKKLAAGGIGPTAISSARRLRSTWLAAWAEWRTGLPGDAAELADLKTRVLQIASEVEGEVRSGQSYGPEMNRRLAAALKPDALGRRPAVALDPLHLLGLAYELCDECQIWFSDPQLVDGGA
jgi:Cap4 dsDNA endonuclease